MAAKGGSIRVINSPSGQKPGKSNQVSPAYQKVSVMPGNIMNFIGNKIVQKNVASPSEKTSAEKLDAGFLKLISAVGKAKADDNVQTDIEFTKEFIESVDRHVKLLLLTMMFLATLIWGVFFYSWYHLPPQIFAYKEIKNIFLPHDYWSGIYTLIACPWFAGLYSLIVVVYPDPRKWKRLCKPRRAWRWFPYIVALGFTLIVNAYWLYSLFLVPSNLKTRMSKLVKDSLNGPDPPKTFPTQFVHVHNYYQCCGIESKTDWTDKIIPRDEIPYPYKQDTVCKKFYYGYSHIALDTCSKGNFSALGFVWPASCCNNHTYGCTTLPTNSEVWTGIWTGCRISEIFLAECTVGFAMFLSATADVVGAFVFYKTRILEAMALKKSLEPPAPHI